MRVGRSGGSAGATSYGTLIVAQVPPAGGTLMISSARPSYSAFEPLADVGEPDAGVALRREAHAGVEHVHRELAVDDLGARSPACRPPAFGSRPCLIAFSTSVCSIIDGNTADFKPSGTLIDRLQPLFHAHRHDLEKRARELDLLAQRRPAAVAHLRHRRAQVADQALLHPRGARRVGLDQLVDAARAC